MNPLLETLLFRIGDAPELIRRFNCSDVIIVKCGLQETIINCKEDGLEKFVHVLHKAADGDGKKYGVGVYARRNEWLPGVRYLIAYLTTSGTYDLIV